MLSTTEINLKITYLKFYWNLPGANELSQYSLGDSLVGSKKRPHAWTNDDKDD